MTCCYNAVHTKRSWHFFTAAAAAVAAASGGLLLESTLSSSPPSGSASPRRPALHLSAKVANNTSSPTLPNSSGNVSGHPYWVSQSLYPCPFGPNTLLWGPTSSRTFLLCLQPAAGCCGPACTGLWSPR